LIESHYVDRNIICFTSRNSITDTLNGYIEIPEFHPWYEAEYDNLTEIEVHGGITFSDYISGSNMWAIGFDTNHFGDAPGPNAQYQNIAFHESEIHKDEKYVTEELTRLVDQTLHQNFDMNKLKETIELRYTKFLLLVR
jgi:hypothetical protein